MLRRTAKVFETFEVYGGWQPSCYGMFIEQKHICNTTLIILASPARAGTGRVDKEEPVKIIAVYHFKGGVGKTATAVNLAYLAAQSGARTLICDLDPQGSASFYFRVKAEFVAGAKGLLKGGGNLEKSLKGTDYQRLDLLPADFSFRNLDRKLDGLDSPKTRLGKVLGSLLDEYEYIILDCPPNITIAAENVFHAADFLLVPIIPTTLAVRSFAQLLLFFKKKRYDHKKIFAFYSMVESRKLLHRESMAFVESRFKRVLHTRIPYAAEIERMGMHRQPVPAFSPNSPAAAAYRSLWEEVEKIIKT